MNLQLRLSSVSAVHFGRSWNKDEKLPAACKGISYILFQRGPPLYLVGLLNLAHRIDSAVFSRHKLQTTR